MRDEITVRIAEPSVAKPLEGPPIPLTTPTPPHNVKPSGAAVIAKRFESAAPRL